VQCTGSGSILRYYIQLNEQRHVQCASNVAEVGVVCTVLRCLGIACRPVTVYDCARTAVVDVHVRADTGKLVAHTNTDEQRLKHWSFRRMITAITSHSIYHVWIECWLRRPDLPTGNDGWQAVDAVRVCRNG
jgi:transglutaminase 1